MAVDMSIYTIPLETEIVELDAMGAFKQLSAKEQAYAAHLAKADWEGAKICLLQCSAESVPIFSLFQLAFSGQELPTLVEAAKAKGLTDQEVSQALMYVAAFYGNLGNYKSFGDTKFIPMLPADRMQLLLSASSADRDKIDSLWQECSERMYSLPERQRQMGLGKDKGISTYFSANCEEADADVSAKFMDSIKISPYNTRLFKAEDGNYTVMLASSLSGAGDDAVGKLCKEHNFEGKKFIVSRGDYAPLMGRVVDSLKDALPFAANDEQKNMLERYIDSFSTGSIEEHKNASRHWVKDVGPTVESYIGFIESYRDPSGVRGEWEGFVSCVNKEVSRKFQALVDGAEEFLELLPWPKAFEKAVFQRPDFTSLEVISFGSSGVPAGINIPNYDDIREHEGFKNVSLGNVLKAGYGAGDKPAAFITESDQELFKKLKGESFEVQVGIHELLGHGSGRLYYRNTPGAAECCNEPHPLKDLVPGCDKITGPFYAEGSTWDSTFGKIASNYEECKAECVGIYLSLETKVLKVFGHEDATADAVHDVTYINWLLMVQAGLKGLEFWTPATSEWRQAHMNARYVILRVLLEAGEGLVTLRKKIGADGKPDVEILLDRSLIPTVGKKAIGNLLLKIQVFKSLADYDAGSKMFASYSEVPPDMVEIRQIVMDRKEPRKLMIQQHIKSTADGCFEMQSFEQSSIGMINSFKARFPSEDPELMELYRRDKPLVTDIDTSSPSPAKRQKS
eukprot:TRINITY_DN17381_c0_g1_i1.p1 TRINITY_DN17381_c0_g1~~TRINITY_DN17381_c0_g1_i1.p1  ORF type:complete len:737 (+),score=131.69 TRINITY_DN17381_c0_g1_i1:84-2294(+)